MQFSEAEFFVSRKPEIATLKSASRKKNISALEIDSPSLYAAYLSEKRGFDAAAVFARESDRFDLSARGKLNTYALFAELATELISDNGRAGLIAPTGIATDANTAPFFRSIFSEGRLVSLFSFYEIRLIFTATDDRNSFCLLTIGDSDKPAEFAFDIRSTADLTDPRKRFRLTAAEILQISPNTQTAPILRSQADAELVSKIYRNSETLIGITPDGELSSYSPIVILNFFSGSNNIDSQFFEEFYQQGPRSDLLPVLRGADIYQYDHRFGHELQDRSGDVEWYGDGRFVPANEVRQRLAQKGWTREWLMGWRDITNSASQRTVIACVIPFSATDDTLSLMLPALDDASVSTARLANLNSLVLDYAAQSKVGGAHIRKGTIAQFPVVTKDFYNEPRLAFITPKVLELTYTSHSLAPFARDLGHDGPPFTWDEDRRALLRAELDAFYARAYGLDRDELRYILDPADVKGPDYPSETFRVLKEKEIRLHGEYRTRRLVLQAWDRMMTDGTFAALDLLDKEAHQGIVIPSILPDLNELADGFWKWEPQTTREDRLRIAAQYALWITDSDQDAPRLRILVACIAEPALLTGALAPDDRKHWERLCGREAKLLPDRVCRMQPNTDAAWRAAFQRLITSGQLEENQQGDWIRGAHFDTTGLDGGSARAQQVLFALQAIRRIEKSRLTTLIAAEDQFVFARLAYGT